MTEFLHVTLCSLVETDLCFRSAYCLRHQDNDDDGGDDGGIKHLWNAGQFL
jgi:hypothetical protein